MKKKEKDQGKNESAARSEGGWVARFRYGRTMMVGRGTFVMLSLTRGRSTLTSDRFSIFDLILFYYCRG